jgi:predicted RNase H-like HicB family nuclease
LEQNGRGSLREAPGDGQIESPAFQVVRWIGLLLERARVYSTGVVFSIELEREDDGRWLAEVPAFPGVMCYGADRDEAVARVQALALRVIAERLEHREAPAEFVNVTFQAPA